MIAGIIRGCQVRALIVMAALIAAGGCATHPHDRMFTAPGDEAMFAPVPVPPDFDAHKAALGLSDLPDDPPAPPSAQSPPPDLPAPARRLFDEAVRLFAEHRYTETILEIEKVLRHAPNHHEPHRLLALACLLSGSDSRARLAAGRALQIRPDDLVCHYVCGRLDQKSGAEEAALRSYRAALKCEPLPEQDAPYRALTHYWLGMLLYERGYYTAAIAQLEAYTSARAALGDRAHDNPELAALARVQRGDVAIRLARAHAILGQYGAAAEALGLAAGQSPDDPALRIEHVRMLVRAGRLDAAAVEARRFVADSRGDPQAVRLLLAVHRRAGKPQAGVTAIREIVAGQPDNIELWLIYVEALVAAGQTDEAIGTLVELIANHPRAGEARWKLITLHRALDDVPAWLSSMAEALAATPADHVRAGVELQRLATARAEQVVAEHTTAGGPQPGSVTADPTTGGMVASARDFLLGRLCDRLDRVDEAARFFERATRRSPDFVPAWLGLAELHIARCRWDEAIDIAVRGLDHQDGPSHELERTLGQCYDGLDDVEQAIDRYQKAIAINDADARSMLLLGQLHERYGQPRRARQQYQAAIAADPDNMPARELYIRNLLSAAGEPAGTAGRISLEFAEMQRRGPKDPATARVAALLSYLQDRDQDRYCQLLRDIVEAFPDDLRSRIELATTLLAFRAYSEARLQAAEILARDPHSAPGGEILAIGLRGELAFEQATRQFDRILACYPNRRSWIMEFAELRMAEQDYGAAAELWKRLMSLYGEAPQQLAYRGMLMEALRLAKRFDEARDTASAWVQQDDSPDLIRKAARWFILAADEAAGDHEAYLQRCRDWLAAEPDDRELRRWLIGIGTGAPLGATGRLQQPAGLIGAGRYAEAEVRILGWLAESPEDATLLQWLAEVLQAAGRHEEAVEVGQGLRETEGRSYILQSIYTRARRYGEAVAAARESLSTLESLLAKTDTSRRADLEITIFEQRRVIGNLLSQAGRYEDAVGHIERMLEEAEGEQLRADLLRTLGFIHQRHDRPELALQRLREAYALAPLDVGLNNDLGYSLVEAGEDLDQAERMIRIAVAEAPRQAAYLDSLGWALYKKGDFKEALRWLGRAASQPGDEDAVIYDHLGDAQWHGGQRDEAITSWQRSLALYERQYADGQTDLNEKLVAGLKRKLAAAQAGDEPPVAPLAGPAADR